MALRAGLRILKRHRQAWHPKDRVNVPLPKPIIVRVGQDTLNQFIFNPPIVFEGPKDVEEVKRVALKKAVQSLKDLYGMEDRPRPVKKEAPDALIVTGLTDSGCRTAER